MTQQRIGFGSDPESQEAAAWNLFALSFFAGVKLDVVPTKSSIWK